MVAVGIVHVNNVAVTLGGEEGTAAEGDGGFVGLEGGFEVGC